MNQRHPIDVLNEVEARTAFLAAAAGAFCVLEQDALPHKRAWEGLLYFLLDMQEILSKSAPSPK